MSVLSDLLIADKAEAREIGECDTPVREWEGIELKALDPVRLSTLWAILTDVTGVESVVALTSRFTLLYEASDDGPWVSEVPCELRERLSPLAALEPEEIEPIARAWAATEEMQGWEYADVEETLREISDLADTARLMGKDLLLWISL
jgi:hypothetical protein